MSEKEVIQKIDSICQCIRFLLLYPSQVHHDQWVHIGPNQEVLWWEQLLWFGSSQCNSVWAADDPGCLLWWEDHPAGQRQAGHGSRSVVGVKQLTNMHSIQVEWQSFAVLFTLRGHEWFGHFLVHPKLLHLMLSSVWHNSSNVHRESHWHVTSPSNRRPGGATLSLWSF